MRNHIFLHTFCPISKNVSVTCIRVLLVACSPAILSYLAQHYTDHAGYGITLQNRFLTESLLSWANSELHRFVVEEGDSDDTIYNHTVTT